MSEQQSTNRAKMYQLAMFPMNNGATNVYYVLILSFIATFGNKVLGLAMVFASFMITGMRVFDAITDPIIGALIDKTNGKFGKFRPYMVIGNAIMAVSVILLYMLTPLIPASAMWLRYTMFVILYAVWVIGYTFQTSVTRSAQAVLTNDPKQRPLFTVFNTIGSLAGMGLMQVLGMVIASDGIAGDYNQTWFALMTPIGIVMSVLLTIVAIIGIWEKDQPKYFGMGGKQEQVKVSEYVQIIKANKPLQRLMVAGGGCKLALSIATNLTVLCMIYGCMTQFGMSISKTPSTVTGITTDSSTQYITNLTIPEDATLLAVTLDNPAIVADAESGSNLFKADYTGQILDMQVYNRADLLETVVDENGVSTLKVKVDNIHVVGLIVDGEGKPAALELNEDGSIKGLELDENGLPFNMDTAQANMVIGLPVSEAGTLVAMSETAPALQLDENGAVSGLKLEETVRLSGKNKYDGLNAIMMVLGYVFSAPFFLLTVRTSQKHGQKKSLMTYVAVALLCYVGVLALLLLWKFGNPAFNLNLAFSFSLKPFNIAFDINLYTILFILFFGVGYGAYYATADMPIPMVADCADYETYRSGKFIPGIMGTLFSLVDKLVSSLSATVVSVVLFCIGINELPTKANLFVPGMNWGVIILFCLIPMIAWIATLWAMKGYALDGKKVKIVQAVNAARKQAIADGMSMEEAMATITDETVADTIK